MREVGRSCTGEGLTLHGQGMEGGGEDQQQVGAECEDVDR